MATLPIGGFGSGANNPTVVARAASAAADAALAAKNANTAPAKANSITKSVVDVGTGLCAALNLHYSKIQHPGYVPDVYEIRFAKPELGNAKMAVQGAKDKALSGSAISNNPNSKLDPSKQSFVPGIRTRGITAGQQIVQFIDQVMRSSDYIANQQNVFYDEATGTWQPNPNAQNKNFSWFNISVSAIPIKYDSYRNDFAYRIIYTVFPYEIPVASEYFSQRNFRGAHKIYNYWFTGENTQVENYTQTFNNMWTQAITGTAQTLSNQYNSNLYQFKRQPMEASNQARPGGINKTFEPGANAADYLYTTDYAKITLNILGDPAWIPSEQPLTPGAYDFRPFLNDGTINTLASAPYFTFAWNRPADYDLNTGLMDVSKNNLGSNRQQGQAGLATESVTYVATRCRSRFNRGKFSQELHGVLLGVGVNDILTNTTVNNTANSADKAALITAAGGDTTTDNGRNTDSSSATVVVNTVSNLPSRVADAAPVSANSSSPLQAGVNTIKAAATTVLSNATTNLLRPYEKALADTVNNYTQTAGNWLRSSITSINNPTLRPAIPPESIVAAVGQTNEFGGLEAPPTLAVKPGENGVGGYSYETYSQTQTGVVVADAGQLPQQGIVNDDQGYVET